MQQEKQKHFLQPGCIFVSKEPHFVSTVLGSCVSVCVWDPIAGFGGMNHHIHAKPFHPNDRSSQFGTIAIPYMIKMSRVKNTLKRCATGTWNNKGVCL